MDRSGDRPGPVRLSRAAHRDFSRITRTFGFGFDFAAADWLAGAARGRFLCIHAGIALDLRMNFIAVRHVLITHSLVMHLGAGGWQLGRG